MVVNLRDRPDRRARASTHRLLVNGDRWRQPIDVLDTGLFKTTQKLARIGGQGLQKSSLAFLVQGVKGKAGLSRATDPRKDRQSVARDLQRDVFQVVLGSTADGDESGQLSTTVWRRRSTCKKGSSIISFDLPASRLQHGPRRSQE